MFDVLVERAIGAHKLLSLLSNYLKINYYFGCQIQFIIKLMYASWILTCYFRNISIHLLYQLNYRNLTRVGTLCILL